MQYYTNYDEDVREEGLKPEKWMLKALAMNQRDCLWGPYEGYMNDDSEDWHGRLVFNSWDDFGPLIITPFNEIVHFYFEIHKESSATTKCSLGLALWMLHPRRSCSRGIHIKKIRKDELETVILYLKEADEYNRICFSKLK